MISLLGEEKALSLIPPDNSGPFISKAPFKYNK
jgi:hypothetical protein